MYYAPISSDKSRIYEEYQNNQSLKSNNVHFSERCKLNNIQFDDRILQPKFSDLIKNNII